MLLNGSAPRQGTPMRFGGDCYGTMAKVPALETHGGDRADGGGDGWRGELLVMGTIHRDGTGGGIGGRSDYLVYVTFWLGRHRFLLCGAVPLANSNVLALTERTLYRWDTLKP